MFVADIFSWWYTQGLRNQYRLIGQKILSVLDFFSINLLIRTLFAPYRQISANEVGDSINSKLSSLFDRLLSRVIGLVVRLVTIVIGLLVIIFQITFSALVLIFWMILPVVPFAGLIAYVLRFMPL